MSLDDNLLAVTGDGDDIAEGASAAIDLDVLSEELLEGGEVNDLVISVGNGADDELLAFDLLLLLGLLYGQTVSNCLLLHGQNPKKGSRAAKHCCRDRAHIRRGPFLMMSSGTVFGWA